MRVNSSTGNGSEIAAFPRRSVYDGQDRVGDIQQHSAHEFVARDRRGNVIGTFLTQREAMCSFDDGRAA
jgi:hypothetical protein